MRPGPRRGRPARRRRRSPAGEDGEAPPALAAAGWPAGLSPPLAASPPRPFPFAARALGVALLPGSFFFFFVKAGSWEEV